MGSISIIAKSSGIWRSLGTGIGGGAISVAAWRSMAIANHQSSEKKSGDWRRVAGVSIQAKAAWRKHRIA